MPTPLTPLQNSTTLHETHDMLDLIAHIYLHFSALESPIENPRRRNSEFTANTNTSRHKHHFCIFNFFLPWKENDLERREHPNKLYNQHQRPTQRQTTNHNVRRRVIQREKVGIGKWEIGIAVPQRMHPSASNGRPILGRRSAVSLESGRGNASGSAISRVGVGEVGQSARSSGGTNDVTIWGNLA